MATITDNDLKMFQERSKTELASGCDIGSIAWDSVIWDLCNEVRRLRGVFKERGDCAKLREALEAAVERLIRIVGCDHYKFCRDEHHCEFKTTIGECGKKRICETIFKAQDALAAPPRNCDVYDNESCRMAYHLHGDGLMTMQAFADWLFAPATETEGGNK